MWFIGFKKATLYTLLVNALRSIRVTYQYLRDMFL